MFVTLGQAIYFLSTVAFGGVFGIIYSLFCGAKKIIQVRFLGVILDLIFFAIFSIIFSIFCFERGFPNVRAYMIVGALFGLILYAKSFHIILAKGVNVLYNRINKFILTKKGKKNDGKEIQKPNRRRHGRCSATSCDTLIGNDIPNRKHKRRKEKTKRIRRANCNL